MLLQSSWRGGLLATSRKSWNKARGLTQTANLPHPLPHLDSISESLAVLPASCGDPEESNSQAVHWD